MASRKFIRCYIKIMYRLWENYFFIFTELCMKIDLFVHIKGK